MNSNIILISTLVIIWWIAIWGLIDIFLKYAIGTSTQDYAIAYSLMASGVLLITYKYPTLLENFI
jgi:hypothetical protein